MNPVSRCLWDRLSRCIACCLILVLVQDPLTAAAAGRHARKRLASAPSSQPALTESQQALHALNRLTFGPRPGDVARVQAMGVQAWIEQQLEPEKIDDSALEARLTAYPAMQLSQKELIERFPSRAMIRAVASGRAEMPRDPIVKAIYSSQVEAYREKQAKDAAATPASNQSKATADAVQNAQNDGAPSPSIAVQEDRLYSDLAATSIVNLPPQQRIEKLASLKPAELRALRSHLTGEETQLLFADLTPAQRETLFALASPERVVAGELMVTRMLKDVYSERQLQAVMTDFWLNHFNVFLRKGPYAPWYLADYERNVIEPRAMGKFEDLLLATAKSPAMLFYLDNFTSVGPHSLAVERAQMRAARFDKPNAKRAANRGLNENYAREVMELHTLGVDGGYTQRDVTEVARVFTGWTLDQPLKGGSFLFDERRHEPGPKLVLGTTIREDGEKEGLKVLHMLAASPATARFLSTKLAVRFVSDNPPASLVDRMAQTYLKTDGDIREVLRTMFTSPEFWSKDAYRAKVKTPEEFVISAVRASGGDVLRAAPLVQALNTLGMPFFGMQTPNGYSWKADAWVNSGDLLNRINFALALTAHRMGTTTSLDSMLKPAGTAAAAGSGAASTADTTAADKESQLEAILLNGEISEQTRATVLKQLAANPDFAVQPASVSLKPAGGKGRGAGGADLDLNVPVPPPADKQTAVLAGLLLGSPDFQRR